MTRTSILIPDDLRENAKALAARDGLSLSAAIRLWISREVEHRRRVDNAQRQDAWDDAARRRLLELGREQSAR